MEVLFATNNSAKIKIYADKLEQNGIELKTLLDLKVPTIGMDNSLFIEGIDEADQPGTHVRRVNGKRLTDDEMIKYYTDLVKEYGGKLTAKWIFGMVVYNCIEKKEYSWSKSNFYFVEKPCEKRNPGYPLDSISVVPKYNKYLVELNDEEKKEKDDNNDDEVIDFIVKNI